MHASCCAGQPHQKTAASMKNRQDSGVVPAMVNVRGLPYVIPYSMPPTGEVSDEQTRAYRKNQMNAEEADPARGAAGRPRQAGGASADFRVRVGGGNFCFEAAITIAVAVRAVVTAVVDGNAA